MQQSLFPPTLQEVLANEEKLKIQKGLALEGALKSNDVNAIYQAQTYLKSIEQREVVNSKSLLVDPMELTSSFGYKDKPFQLSYEVLRAMSRTHIVKAIIETRKEQVLTFCEPQRDKFSTGFVIQKKSKFTEIKKEVKLSKQEEKKIEWLINYVLECGVGSNSWHHDTFDVFIGKIVQDTLTFDQATFEIARNRKGEPIEFLATDASTYRIADTYNDDEETTRHPEKVVKGYLPAYVQIYQSAVKAEFYPWELCFGIRNPTTSIYANGYGRAELEDMIATVTAILNSDMYNASFFKVGSAPKGLLRYSGNINQNSLEDFRRQWTAQVAGAMNAHKIPILNADKMEFINTHVPNKDMEFSKYQEFLIKIACAIYKIDPAEIGFPMAGSSQQPAFGGGEGNEEKLEYSKDKGLKPLLKKIQFWINKYVINQIDPEYEFRFVGIEGELDRATELEEDIQLVGNIMTLNEIREKRNLDPIDGGDIPLNPVYLQALGMQQQNEMQQQQMAMQQDQREQTSDPNNPFDSDPANQEEDPFMKSLHDDIERLIGTEL